MLRPLGFLLVLSLLQACAQAGEDPDNGNDKPDAGMVEPGDVEDCTDGIDNDGDGAVDCFDSDCDGAPKCTEAECDDGIDNDGDGPADCLDRDCDGVAGCEFATELTCDDGVDNNGNGPIDCRDMGCAGVGSCEYPREVTCNDDFDNDGDGSTDCADADCDGLGGCEAVERSCGDGIDNDVDDLIDCDDSDCAGAGPCLVAECPGGSVAVNASATDTPLSVPDAATATSVISVADAGLVTRVSVGLSATHELPSDLDISLIGPDGTRVLLSADRGYGTDAYSDTLFADAATTPISTATEPFTGAFQPEEPLSSLAGSSTAGNWTLEVVDDASIDTGTLTAFTVYLCHCAEPCAPEASCTDTLDNDDDGAADCADPGCDGVDGCEFNRERTCGDDVDNDGDGVKDCLDADCDGVGICEFERERSCGDDIDNDGDGAVDCDDPDCNAYATCLLVCPEGSSMFSFTSTDTPLAIVDLTTITATANATEAGTIATVAVEVSAAHTWTGDLQILLESPAGTSVELSTGNGGSGDNYTDTLFHDGAPTSITAGTAPFTGPYQPEAPLGALNGEVANGAWTLSVEDTVSSDSGTLTEFTVFVCVTPA